ncbi:hypothetical protein E1B28_000069 [Marasmius oreades]|uniref:DUF6535 domain-containing protein n=1 Tax=Marasmius oreades TaxID=181124 RepID=A0A9P7V0I1_9AGAR|nr:uncharacterized protein E1B28_000069 [Marasmius oreades]KAG7098095.1 hypothetical protein E1B28_000069 [Marasmius oreades]
MQAPSDPTLKLLYEFLIKKEEEKRIDFPPDPESAKPTLQESWAAITKTVVAFDEDMVGGYKEDIDTLLVFAGLFSAVVTAFTIESYQWLKENPQDTTVTLLQQISYWQMNGTALPQPPTFTPSSSDIRINTFWFLSLIIALVDALFALLCKQWVREHKRQINTRTPGQALALRWLRYQSFERWHVPKILASLPILLEVALFLFFTGVLELLWSRHPIPFGFALFVVGAAMLFYFITTFLPGISIVQQVLQTYPYFAQDWSFLQPKDIDCLPLINFVCPYKSPQSWLMFQLLSATYHLPFCRRSLFSFLCWFHQYWSISQDDLNKIITKNVLKPSSWTTLDLSIVERFSRIAYCPDLYELMGFRWLVQETCDIPSMLPHLQNVLDELPIHLVMHTIFDLWGSPVGFNLNKSLKGFSVTRSDNDLFGDHLSTHDLNLAFQILCFQHLLVTFDHNFLTHTFPKQGATHLWHCLKESQSSQFNQAFFCPDTLLLALHKDWRKEALDFHMQHWDELDYKSQLDLIQRLTRSILSFIKLGRDIGSTTLASNSGLDFLMFLHNKICGRRNFFQLRSQHEGWIEVLKHLRNIHGLPPSHFKPVLGYFPPFMDELRDLLKDASTPPSVLVPVLDSYEKCWDRVDKLWEKKKLILMLSTHIQHASHSLMLNILNPESANKDSSQEPLHAPPPSSIIFSEQGLDFLTFINKKLIEEPELVHYCTYTAIQRWVNALDCIHDLRSFEPIPKYRRWTGESLGWWKAERTHTGVEAGGNPEGDGSNRIEDDGIRSTDAPTFGTSRGLHTGNVAGSMEAVGYEKDDSNAGDKARLSSHNNKQPGDGTEAVRTCNTFSQTSSGNEHHSKADITKGKGKDPYNHIRQRRKSEDEHEMFGGPDAENNV